MAKNALTDRVVTQYASQRLAQALGQISALRAGSEDSLSLRVAARYQLATEFSTPEALKEYLHDHPDADKSKHHVKKDEGGHGHSEEKGEKKSWRDKLKGLGEKAQAFLKSAPKEVTKFLEDDAHRRTVMKGAHEALTKAPEKLVKNLISTAKHEVEEFKEAGAGIKAVMKGGKMNDHQKKALKTVATHLALTAAATALTVTGGPLAIFGAFGKSMAKHVAMKAVSRAVGHVHILEELGHIGHGIQHLMEKLAADKEESPEDMLAKLVLASMAKELEELGPDALEDIIKGIDQEGK